MRDFEGKVVLVTGGSRGIGRATVLLLASRGARVVAGYVGNEGAAQEVVSLATAQGGGVRALRFDVADAKACQAAVEDVLATEGKLDVLVNNAGVAIDGLLVRTRDEDWDRQLETNLKGAFALARAAARPMMRARQGAIVNVTSVVGETGNAGQAAYAASKAGLVGLTRSIARELASRNIRVNAVSPGFVGTDMTARIAGDAKERMLEAIPLGRLGTAEEVAEAIAFLASDAARYITGEVLKVNGGMYM